MTKKMLYKVHEMVQRAEKKRKPAGTLVKMCHPQGLKRRKLGGK
jgi:hypothetical protein